MLLFVCNELFETVRVVVLLIPKLGQKVFGLGGSWTADCGRKPELVEGFVAEFLDVVEGDRKFPEVFIFRIHAAYFAELDAQAARAAREYGLLLLPGLELTYNDLDPFLAAHALAIGCRAFIPVDDGIEAALGRARSEGAALVAAHPFHARRGVHSSRATMRFDREWRTLGQLVDRWELFNRYDLFASVARRGLPAVANGDFHRPEHLPGWKTLLPCAKEERSVIDYLRSPRPAFLTRVDTVDASLLRAA